MSAHTYVMTELGNYLCDGVSEHAFGRELRNAAAVRERAETVLEKGKEARVAMTVSVEGVVPLTMALVTLRLPKPDRFVWCEVPAGSPIVAQYQKFARACDEAKSKQRAPPPPPEA